MTQIERIAHHGSLRQVVADVCAAAMLGIIFKPPLSQLVAGNDGIDCGVRINLCHGPSPSSRRRTSVPLLFFESNHEAIGAVLVRENREGSSAFDWPQTV